MVLNSKYIQIKYTLVILLTMLLSFQQVEAQEDPKAKLYLKNVHDTIKLRWLVTDFSLWKTCNKQGYDIYRKELASSNTVKINDSTIRAFTLDEWGYRNMIFEDSLGLPDPNMDTLSAMAIGYLYPEETGISFDMPDGSDGIDFGQDPRAMMHMFHSIATLQSKEAAYISGYTFSDTTFEKNTDYEYFLCKAGDSPEHAIALERINSSDAYSDLTPKIENDRTNKKVSFLFWKNPDTLNATVSAYQVYRSEQIDDCYTSLVTPSFLSLLDPYKPKEDPAKYKDATLEKGKVYYYKIRAVDVFGDYSDFSEPYMVTEKTLLSSIPIIVKAQTSKSFENTIEWNIKEYDEENINAQFVYRNSIASGKFVPISNQLGSEVRKFTDETPINTNYYKIMAIGNANDTVWSELKFVNIPDSIPPSTPEIVSAVCDSTGVVTIKWKHGNEKDLHQFNVYIANYEHEEFSRIANIGVDTLYSDTISLGVLDKSVFYKVVAFDISFNSSEFSEAFEVIRYDTIPPNPPIITSIKSDEEGVNLKWACSSSPDIKHSILLRKLNTDTTWQQLRLFGISGNDYETYIDTTVVKGIKYQYTLTAIDEFGLSSQGGRVLNIQAYDSGIREAIEEFRAKLSKRKHTVKLQWEYIQSDVERFIIYRTINEGAKSILAGTKGNVYEYYDENVGQGNSYGYSIKAVYKDGAESPITEEIIIEFK